MCIWIYILVYVWMCIENYLNFGIYFVFNDVFIEFNVWVVYFYFFWFWNIIKESYYVVWV